MNGIWGELQGSSWALLPEELTSIADGDEQLLGLLALAYEACDSQGDGFATASRFLPGTLTERWVLWDDLMSAVTTWRMWDLAKDGQGRVEELGIPSREAADEHVWTVLACISRRMNPVGAL